MRKFNRNKAGINENRARNGYLESTAPEMIETGEDRLTFPGAILLPLAVRANELPGMPQRPWGRVRAVEFLPDSPAVFSIALRREAPDVLRGSLRARRTLMEGVLMALAEKTGRRPSQAEQAVDAALDEAESRLALGEPAFRAALLTGIYAARDRPEDADAARRSLESRLRAAGFQTQRLAYIPERALHHIQPAGLLFPGISEPVLELDEAARLLPRPAREVLPAADSVWLGSADRDGRDVFFSPSRGFDPGAPPAPHATSLVLGEMGSGKTSLMRSILIQRLMQGRRIISLDPEGENNRLCRAMGGQVIPAGMPADRESCLLHPLEAESPGELLFAVRFVVSALNDSRPIPPQANAVIHDLIQTQWDRLTGRAWPLHELVNGLARQDADTADITALLHPFTRGGLWDGFFDRPMALLSSSFFDSSVPAGHCTWWNFDLSGLREENKAIVHAVLVWFLYRVVAVTQAPVDVFLDEGWRLLRSPAFAALLDELGRRARKRGIGILLGTHLPEDLAKQAGTLGLASAAFVGRLGPGQAAGFLHGLGLPALEAESHAERIARLPPHHFYAVPGGGRGSLFPFRVRIPPGWLSVWAEYGAAR